jgi:hypothetical protein
MSLGLFVHRRNRPKPRPCNVFRSSTCHSSHRPKQARINRLRCRRTDARKRLFLCVERVNSALSATELRRLHLSVVRDRSFGVDARAAVTARRLVLEHNLRPEGRPPQENQLRPSFVPRVLDSFPGTNEPSKVGLFVRELLCKSNADSQQAVSVWTNLSWS